MFWRFCFLLFFLQMKVNSIWDTWKGVQIYYFYGHFYSNGQVIVCINTEKGQNWNPHCHPRLWSTPIHHLVDIYHCLIPENITFDIAGRCFKHRQTLGLQAQITIISTSIEWGCEKKELMSLNLQSDITPFDHQFGEQIWFYKITSAQCQRMHISNLLDELIGECMMRT